MALRPGEQLGPYEVVSPLGAGGMGEVYRARDPRLGREVALKILPEDISDPQRLRRFEEEARAVAALNDPHILAVFDIGRDGDTPYVVFELLEGQTLHERLERGALPPRKVVEYAEQLCQGLAAAHARGIIHRDLKPANIFLTKDGTLKILDFGLARLTRGREHGEATGTTQTSPGTVLGTLGYLSPEQAQGMKADARSDVFAVGAVLYEMLSGQRAFGGETTAEALVAVLKEDPPEITPEAGPIPPALDRIVRRCLEKEPDERFQSAKDVAFALEAVSGNATGPSESPTSGPQGARWPKWLAGSVVGIALFAGGFFTERVLTRTTPPVITQLTFQRGALGNAHFTPDGQSVVYNARWQGHLAEVFSKRLDSLEPVSLGLPAGKVDSVSPTAELAFNRTPEENIGSPQVGMLGRVTLGSDSIREVLDDVLHADWTPDGQLLALRRVGRTWQLEWPLGRAVRTWQGIHWHPPRVSPGGDTVAYADPSEGLHLLDRAGHDTHLAELSVQSFTWHPTKDEIWYTTWPLGPGVQLRAVDRSGQDRLVHHFGHPVTIQDISVDGRALVIFFSPARLGFTRVSSPGAEQEHDVSFYSRTMPVALSGDGGTVLLQKGFAEDPQGGYWVRPTGGGSAVRIRGSGEGEALDLSANGDRVLFLDRSPEPHIVAVPVGAGEPEPIPLGHVIPSDAKWFPDGRSLLIKGSEEGGEEHLFVLTPDDSRPRLLSRDRHDVSLANLDGVHISPDGQKVAVHDGRVITLFPADGGQPMTVSETTGVDSLVGWGADGRTLLLRQDQWSYSAPARLLTLDLLTARRDWLRDIAPPVHTGLLTVGDPLVARGGDAYAYYYTVLNGNLFLVEGLE